MTTTPDPAAAPAVLFERLAGHVALVTLNRPAARNAINGEVTARLDALVAETEADPDIWVVVLTGNGREAFCAGADLKAISAGQASQLRSERGGFAGFVFAERSKPWIAAVNGPALAGGCELVLACDLVVAAEHAVFGLPEVKRGLIASAGGLFRLPRALPPAIAREMVATGEPIPAARAHELGMVNRLVPAEQVREVALGLAAEIAENAPLAVRESLAIARRANDLDDAALRQMSAEGALRNAATEDFQEGPRAFIEKRAPRWSGR